VVASLVVDAENKVPVVAAVPLSMRRATPGIIKLRHGAQRSSFAANADWAPRFLAIGCEVISDGLACFRAVAESRLLSIILLVVKGRHPNELPEFFRLD